MIRLKKIAVAAFVLLIIFLVSFQHFLHTEFHQRNNLLSMPSLPISIKSYQPCHQMDWALVDINVLTARQVIDYFHWDNQTSCRLYNDFGGWVAGPEKSPTSAVDGQRAVCIDPASLGPRQRNCTVYSFGINNEWSFDDAMEQYGCQVYAFDPSMTEVEDEFDRSPSIHFYKLGLGAHDETLPSDIKTEKDRLLRTAESGWRLRTLSTIYRELNHEGRDIDYLKIDIEGTEWQVLPQIIESGMLASVRQMGIEFHLPGNETLERYRELAGILHVMETRHGMVRFDSKPNPWYKGTFTQLGFYDNWAYDIAWYNKRFL